MKKLNEIKIKTKDLLLTTTFHGIQNIIKTNSIIVKFLWIFCLIGSSLYCVFLIKESAVNYYDYEVVTSIKTIYEDKSQLPAISICSSNNYLNHSNILGCRLFNKNCIDYFQIYKNAIFGQCLRFNGGKNSKNESIEILNSNIGTVTHGLEIDFLVSNQNDVN